MNRAETFPSRPSEPDNKEEFIRMQLYDTSYQYFGPKTWNWPEDHSSPRKVDSIDENLALA